MSTHVLRLSCVDRPGLVRSVSGLLFDCGGNILDAQQFDDCQTGRFFMRVVFELGGEAGAVAAGMEQLAATHGMDWLLRSTEHRQRTLLMVSRFDHCLVDLLYRHRIGELAFEPVAIVSNHPREALAITNIGASEFHHFPVSAATKADQERRIEELIEEKGVELVILARYMQILSDRLASRLAGRCINIHHSFLPGFKGARPYHQAHARGVKIIGATAHYVTPSLDEGPIIAQDVEHISHADTPDDLVRKGRDIERRVLARAVRNHLEERVLINGAKTVVFRD